MGGKKGEGSSAGLVGPIGLDVCLDHVVLEALLEDGDEHAERDVTVMDGRDGLVDLALVKEGKGRVVISYKN